MTIVVGIVCRDGVVLASDSMGSSGKTAIQVQKARALDSAPIVWATSWSAYMNQQIEAEIAAATKRKNARPTPLKLAERLRKAAIDAWKVPIDPPGSDDADKHAHVGEALLLGWDPESCGSMIHLPPDLAPVECRDRVIMSIGSGHEFAAVAHQALEHHLRRSVDLAQGRLIAYRIVDIVCRVSSWGVAPPIQIAVADAEGSRLLDETELEEIEGEVQGWVANDAANFPGYGGERAADEELPTLDSLRESVRGTHQGRRTSTAS